jgi:hypothetical protein
VYLILGQGLAGTALALRFHERGIPFHIWDDGHNSSGSMVAAGLWNPIVFRRVNKSWMADEFIPALEEFYPSWEDKWKANFYHPKPVWRIHTSKQELDKWFEKKSLPGFKPYLFNLEERYERVFGKKPPHGEGEVRHAGYLDLPEFLNQARSFFQDIGVYSNKQVSESQEPKDLRIGKGKPEGIIDARGYRSGLSPWWNYLPWGLTKGEVLTLRCPDLKLNRTFNSGFFLLPLENGDYRLGATFNWDERDERPTKAAREELLRKFSAFFGCTYKVVDHKAGVRPTVQDRRPLMGKHPRYDDVFLFNGLGTKGVMLAPYLSDHFANWLEGKVELMPEIDTARFEHLRGQKNPSVNYPKA